jgi:WD40 repeat protein
LLPDADALVVTGTDDEITSVAHGKCPDLAVGIMAVAFVPHNKDGNGHNFFSASKDRNIKYWDGDTLVVTGTDDEITSVAHGKCPDLAVVTNKALDLFEQYYGSGIRSSQQGWKRSQLLQCKQGP